MSVYYYLLICTMFLAFGFLIRTIFIAQMDIPIKLFMRGVEQENEGHFDKAALIYTSALIEFKRIRSRSKLTHSITRKLHLLSDVMVYRKPLELGRTNSTSNGGPRRPIIYGTEQTKAFFKYCVLSYNLN